MTQSKDLNQWKTSAWRPVPSSCVESSIENFLTLSPESGSPHTISRLTGRVTTHLEGRKHRKFPRVLLAGCSGSQLHRIASLLYPQEHKHLAHGMKSAV